MLNRLRCYSYLVSKRIFNKKIKLDLGSKDIQQRGWISSDLPSPAKGYNFLKALINNRILLNATRSTDWKNFFYPNSIDYIFSEHMFEHLDDSELKNTLENVSLFLKKEGNLRIAVPDGYRDDKFYQSEVSPPRFGHKQLFTIDSLTNLLNDFGFEVFPLEFYKNSKLNSNPYSDKKGKVRRSLKHDTQENFRYQNHSYTSLIVDAKKN